MGFGGISGQFSTVAWAQPWARELPDQVGNVLLRPAARISFDQADIRLIHAQTLREFALRPAALASLLTDQSPNPTLIHLPSIAG